LVQAHPIAFADAVRGALRVDLDALEAELELEFAAAETLPPGNDGEVDLTGRKGAPPEKLSFVPGGISFRDGPIIELKGYALEVLRQLYTGLGHRRSANDLRKAIWEDYPIADRTIGTHVCFARNALRKAVEAAGFTPPIDPIPNADRGTNRLAWRLDLP
jgi:hypothetical protein